MLKYLLFQLSLHTLAYLPVRALYPLVCFIAGLVYLLARGPRRNVLDNLRHVMGPDAPASTLRSAARQVFRNVALYYADLIRMPRMDLEDFFARRLRYHGFDENLMPAVRSGSGVIILSVHYGNPELGVQGLLPGGVKVFAVTEPLVPPRLSRLVDRLRASHGHEFAPVGVGSVKRVIRTLKSGGVVALMGDRDVEGPRASLPFFGVEAMMPTGPIEVALRTGATVIPAFSRRVPPDRIDAYLEEPLELERTGDMEHDARVNTLRFLERVERRLREDPGQWAVLEAIWQTPEAAPAPPPIAAGRKP